MERPVFRNVRMTIIDGAGCDSILHASQVEPLNAPSLQSLGLLMIAGLGGIRTKVKEDVKVCGAFGSLTPTFIGNGSPEGHQALMGFIVEKPYLYFDKTGFPNEIVNLVEDTVAHVIRRKVEVVRYPGTDDVNGVRFINYPGIGDAHLASGRKKGKLLLPMYASSDSLIQLALHLEVAPQELIEKIGKAVREMVDKEGYRIARIIMRPFKGESGFFERVSEGRRDYGVDPDGDTLIDYLAEAGIPVFGIGKAASMLNYHGFNPQNIQKLRTDEERMKAIVADFSLRSKDIRFSLDNLVGTDELYGHTRKPKEYSQHLAMIALFIGQGMLAMTADDLWIITADHGNDPLEKSHNNHTRENVPLFAYHPRMKGPINFGVGASYADVAATIADNFGISNKIKNGESFLKDLL